MLPIGFRDGQVIFARRWNRFIPIITNSPIAINITLGGSGTVVLPSREKAALNVGGVEPPTMSVPTRSQSGSRLSSRVHACKSVMPVGNGVVPPAPVIGREAESQ